MANDINSVYIQVIADTGEVQRNLTAAEKAFLNYNNRIKRTGGLSKSISRSLLKTAAGVLAVERAVTGAVSVLRRMIQDVSAFQVMSVELKVATGSAVQADAAFAMLQDTAKRLPSSLKDLTTGFVRLKNMGLDASASSLISFSNTAAAMGKSLKQFVEAVADANTREFERLKEFGILARNEGDKIRFVFRGVTTEVENSSKDIVKFLTDIGNNEFAGAATEQIDTLAARFTKLQDSIFNLNIAFGEGASGALGDFLKFLTEQADTTAFNKGLSDIRESMIEIEKIPIGSRFLNVFGGPDTREVEKGGAALKAVFRNLSAKQFPAAVKVLREQKQVVMDLKEEGGKAFEAEKKKLEFMLKGFKVAERRLKQARQITKETEKNNADLAKQDRIQQQRDIISEASAEALFRLNLDQAKADKDILRLKQLKTEARQKLIPIEQNLAKYSDDEIASEDQLKGFLRDKARLQKEIAGIQSAIAEASSDEAEQRRETLKNLKEEREERLKVLQEQMKVALEVGNVEDYNAQREKKRQLASRLATSEGIKLTEALKEKYDNISYSIEVLREKLKDKSLGAKEIKEANDQLDEFQSELDQTQKAIDTIAKKANESAEELKEFFDDVREGIAEAVVEGENFQGILESILKQLAKTQLIKAMETLGGGGGGIGGFFKSLFRANGGPVTANKPYIVGERGPELFTPSGSGMITSNERMRTGGGSFNIVNNFTIDGGDKAEMQRMIAGSVSTSVQLAVSKISDNKRRRIS